LACLEAILLTFLGVLLLSRLYPLLWWGDEPELLTAAWEQGIAHPTGYPVYLVLVRLFGFLPLGGVAWKGHLFSTLCVLVGMGALFRVPEWNSNRPGWHIGWRLGCVSLGLMPLLVSQAVIAEVYTLSFALVTLTLLSARQFGTSPSLGAFALLSMVCGLSVGHHRLLGLMLPGLTLALVEVFKEKPARWKWLIPGMPIFLLALFGPYLLLVARSWGNPPLDYENPETLAGFWSLFSASQFRVDQQLVRLYEGAMSIRGMGPSPSSLTGKNLAKFPEMVLNNLLGMTLFWVLGVWVLARDHTRIAIAGFLCLLLPLCFVAQYHVGDIESLFLLPLLLAALPVGLGSAVAMERAARVNRAAAAGLGAVLVLFLGMLSISYPSPPEEVLELPERYARRALATAQPGSILLAVPPREGLPPDYVHFPLLFQSAVAERNPTVTVLSTGFFISPWYRSTFEAAGLDTALFDRLEGKTDDIRLMDFSREIYLDKLEGKGLSTLEDSRPAFFRLKGRIFGESKKAVDRLVAESFFSKLGEKAVFATSPPDDIEAYLNQGVVWEEVLDLPMRTQGFRPLDLAPIPTGSLFRGVPENGSWGGTGS
jgi:hypothetical protein